MCHKRKLFEKNQTDSLLLTLFETTRCGMMRKLEVTSGLIREMSFIAHHVEPRVKLCLPREESFPVPLKYIDVTINTHTPLESWNVDEERE